MKKLIWLLLLISFPLASYSQYTLIQMDQTQRDHLRAYGLAYWALQSPRVYPVEWLLNYRGGSFLISETKQTPKQAAKLGVKCKIIGEAELASIRKEIEENNMESILLEKAPKIAVYVPPTHDPWDDAVTLVLEYAQIPYDKVWDPEVLAGKLNDYDWLHLHHEDFTGQYGKFYASFRFTDWYQEHVKIAKAEAKRAGFPSVAAHKYAVALAIVDYVSRGGFLFAMCSACDTLDIALAAGNLDIVPPEIDGTGITPGAQAKLNFNKCLAFTNFKLIFDPNIYEHSNIDTSNKGRDKTYKADEFTLFEFAAKYDPIPTMLTQCHTARVKDFRGQCTAFNRKVLKDKVTILGDFPGEDAVKYIHGSFGKGTFTFLGGHDPEDYEHIVGEGPTDLSLHKNSPGYRLILNNILFPAAKKRKLKT